MHHLIQTSTGGFKRLMRHLRPTPLDLRKKRLKAISESIRYILRLGSRLGRGMS